MRQPRLGAEACRSTQYSAILWQHHGSSDRQQTTTDARSRRRPNGTFYLLVAGFWRQTRQSAAAPMGLLPCRRSRVRAPSAAYEKALLSAGFFFVRHSVAAAI